MFVKKPYKIPLTRGKEALVSKEDFYILSGFKWLWDGKYAARTIHKPRKHKVKMHRIIMRLRGETQGDHINGNRLDNRRENLREVTPSQNSINRPLRVDNKSGHKGVYWYEKGKCWRAKITAQGKEVYLGQFPSFEAAKHAYLAEASILHGEYARKEYEV